jgi:hypothetical protein
LTFICNASFPSEYYSDVQLTVILIPVTDFKVDAVNWPGTNEEVFSTVADGALCPSRTSGDH